MRISYPPYQTKRQFNHGFSLVELMISITIGLIITVAAMSAYLGSASASKVTDAQMRMNEDAQTALSVLSQQLRLVGANQMQANRADAFRRNPVFERTYVGGTSTAYGTTTLAALGVTTTPGTYTMATFSVLGCDGTFSNVSTAANLTSLSCVSGTTTLPDSIAVSYEADGFNTIATAGGAATDCAGGALPTTSAVFPSGPTTTATWAVADNRYYIKTVAGVPSLYCKGAVSTEQPLVENVEDIQFLYGVVSTSTTDSTATVAGYLTADQVLTESTMAALGVGATFDPARWGRVISVRICVVVRSEQPVLTDAASASYFKCDGSLDSSKNDLRLRRAYSTTVVLRNRRS